MNNDQTTNETRHHHHQGFGPKGRGCGPFSKMFFSKFRGRSGWENALGGHFKNRKAANIEETESAFKISLYAAGLVKSNFKVSATGDVLTIAYSVPQSEQGGPSQFTYQEYEPGAFERSFQLNGKVLTDSISASYTDGVLVVTLPKNPETNKPAQEVNVN